MTSGDARQGISGLKRLPKDNRIYQKDALDGLRQLDDESVDLVVTDPPYNIASKNRKTIRHGKLMSTMEAWGAWDCLHPFDHELLMLQVISQCYRVLKPGGTFYLFTSEEDNGYYIRKAKERGFIFRIQLAIAKTTQLPSIFKNSWRSAYQLCLCVSKGKAKTFNFLSQHEMVNLYSYSIHHKQTTHPTEKPLEFIKRLVSVSSNESDVVLDPFMGSGTTAVACQELGRRYIGFERNPEYVKMAQNRLKGGSRAKRCA